jgi:hypothetical protein
LYLFFFHLFGVAMWSLLLVVKYNQYLHMHTLTHAHTRSRQVPVVLDQLSDPQRLLLERSNPVSLTPPRRDNSRRHCWQICKYLSLRTCLCVLGARPAPKRRLLRRPVPGNPNITLIRSCSRSDTRTPPFLYFSWRRSGTPATTSSITPRVRLND